MVPLWIVCADAGPAQLYLSSISSTQLCLRASLFFIIDISLHLKQAMEDPIVSVAGIYPFQKEL